MRHLSGGLYSCSLAAAGSFPCSFLDSNGCIQDAHFTLLWQHPINRSLAPPTACRPSVVRCIQDAHFTPRCGSTPPTSHYCLQAERGEDVLRPRHWRPVPLCAQHPALCAQQGQGRDEGGADVHHRAVSGMWGGDGALVGVEVGGYTQGIYSGSGWAYVHRAGQAYPASALCFGSAASTAAGNFCDAILLSSELVGPPPVMRGSVLGVPPHRCAAALLRAVQCSSRALMRCWVLRCRMINMGSHRDKTWPDGW